VTGTIPGFVDVVLNFGSSILNEDNLIGQLTSDKRGSDMWTLDKWSINFFGDDTWIKLFPGHFKEEEGTTSFFVADFTEVGRDVTYRCVQSTSEIRTVRFSNGHFPDAF
jgi:ethanolaminephosphotransferase